MRDIRSELKERLEEAASKRQEFLALAKDAEVELASVRRMLDIEERRYGDTGRPPRNRLYEHRLPRTPPFGRSPIAGFLEKTLADGKPRSLENLADTAIVEGIGVGEGKSLKRSLNATLLSFERGKLARRDNKGRWILAKSEASSAQTDEASQ